MHQIMDSASHAPGRNCAVVCLGCARAKKRNRMVTGISVAVVAGTLYAGYVAYERRLLQIQQISWAIDWFSDRAAHEMAMRRKLDGMAKQLDDAEKRAARTLQALERLSKTCAPDQQRKEPARRNSGTPWQWPTW